MFSKITERSGTSTASAHSYAVRSAYSHYHLPFQQLFRGKVPSIAHSQLPDFIRHRFTAFDNIAVICVDSLHGWTNVTSAVMQSIPGLFCIRMLTRQEWTLHRRKSGVRDFISRSNMMVDLSIETGTLRTNDERDRVWSIYEGGLKGHMIVRIFPILVETCCFQSHIPNPDRNCLNPWM